MSDIQFDDPEISILLFSALKVIGKFTWIFSILLAKQSPWAIAFQIRHTFEKTFVRSVLATNDKYCAGVTFACYENCRKPAGGAHGANQPSDF